jgi:hypothetical protein
MRFAIFLLSILFLLPLQTRGQDSPLFVIVNCSEGVMLDGKVVTPGQVVYGISKQLAIPNKGYAGIVTNKGYSYLLKSKISIKIKNIDAFIFKKKYDPKLGGAVHLESPIRLIDNTRFHSPYLMGDSILLGWWPTESEWIRIEFSDMSDRPLRADSTNKNWMALGTTELFNKDSVILFSVYAKGYKFSKPLQHLLNRSKGEKFKTLTFDLSRLPYNDNVLFRLALFELYDFFYDNLFALYQLERSNQQPQNKIFANYVSQLKKQYQFELFDFIK